tara:strand:- start:3966 stop:5891 length:1926 start_codon:yes stop_codon:yes gene_type:complete
MPLTKLQFRPGINRESTSYSNEGGWFDSEKVRFRFGFPEKIGGWTKYTVTSFLGTCRSLHSWVALDGTLFLGVGTHLKYYINQGGGYNDITPIRATTTNGITFAATNGSSTITATDSSHGATEGDFVTISGAVSLGGNITANVLNQEYQIDKIVDTNTYQFTARLENTTIKSITTTTGLNPTPVLANSSDTGNGGSGVDGEYQATVGLDTSLTGTGWNAGVWGRGTWNSSADLSVDGATLRIWSHDNFGEDLIINARDAGIYYWDKTSGVGTRSVSLYSLSGADKTPTIAKKVIVSDRDRHVIAFGCDGEFSIGTQDPLLIRFSSQESLTDWAAKPTNTAGELRIGSGSEIITAIETKQQVLVFTDVSLHAMQFLGPPFIFGIATISENVTIMGPLAAIAVEDMVFWMGQQEFYMYGGRVQRLPCTVRDYVFNDFNILQGEKVTAATNTAFSEVWWFYPSANSEENDRYVIYNYQQQIWYYGTLNRTVWLDRGIIENPIAASTDHFLYRHEQGLDDGSTAPASAINAHIESSQMDVGDGDKFLFINRILPDITFRDSTASSPSATLTLKSRNFAGGNYLQTENATTTQSVAGSTSVVEQFTETVSVRLRGRSFALRVASTETEVTWRLGTPRVNLRTDGGR